MLKNACSIPGVLNKLTGRRTKNGSYQDDLGGDQSKGLAG